MERGVVFILNYASRTQRDLFERYRSLQRKEIPLYAEICREWDKKRVLNLKVNADFLLVEDNSGDIRLTEEAFKEDAHCVKRADRR